MKRTDSVQIRWITNADMPAVLRIESACFAEPWSESDFRCVLNQRSCSCMVAEHSKRVIGFIAYELHKKRLHLLNFAVDPEAQRQGVGRQMVDRLKQKLSEQRRTFIDANVREQNLEAQQFFKSQGFRCIDIARGFYETLLGDTEDAYVFRYSINQRPLFRPSNRISEYMEASE